MLLRNGGAVILKLLISKHSKRVNSLVGRKCRASKVKVLKALNSNDTVFYSSHDNKFKYTVGEWISTEMDDDIRVECTKGIHFFITKKEAEEYA